MSPQRRRLVMIFVAAAVVTLAACSSGGGSAGPSGVTCSASPSGTVQITLSHGYTDVEEKAIKALVAQWNGSNPHIQVKLLFNSGNDNALQKTLAGFAAGTYPDVAYE